MSLTAFKKKSVINYGSKRSGKSPGGVWLPQGPFGHATKVLKEAIANYGAVGFSINGGHRNVGGVGRDMKMSKSGTPYRGSYPIGWGGTYGKYPSATLVGNQNNGSSGAIPNSGSKQSAVEPLLNSRVVNTMGSQYIYIKNIDGLIMVNIQTIGSNQIILEIKRIQQVNYYIFRIKQRQIRVHSRLIM